MAVAEGPFIVCKVVTAPDSPDWSAARFADPLNSQPVFRRLTKIMLTFNGWNIVPMPATPAASASVECTAEDIVALSTSPFTGQRRVYNWRASYLTASMSMPALTHVRRSARRSPAGRPTGTPVADGAGQTGYTLNLRAEPLHGLRNPFAVDQPLPADIPGFPDGLQSRAVVGQRAGHKRRDRLSGTRAIRLEFQPPGQR